MINITSWTDLAAISSAPTESYILTKDLTANSPDYVSAGGNAWVPIASFSGTFDGNGYVIADLTIDVAIISGNGKKGLFGILYGATITNLGVVGALVKGYDYVGILAAQAASATNISKCYSSGEVTGFCNVGGLVGEVNTTSTVTNCYSKADVFGILQDSTSYYGGLIGLVYDVGATVSNSYSTGKVTMPDGSGAYWVAGFIGANVYGTVNYCYSTGLVTNGQAPVGFAGAYGAHYNYCGWFCHPTGPQTPGTPGETVVVYEVKKGGGGSFIDDTEDWFYSKARAIYSAWDFATPVWYEHLEHGGRYPTLRKQEINSVLPMFLGQDLV